MCPWPYSSKNLLKSTKDTNHGWGSHWAAGGSEACLGVSNMAEDGGTKIKNHHHAPFDIFLPSKDQTRSCWQNYLDFHRCEKAVTTKGAKGVDVSVYEWNRCVYKSLCPISWFWPRRTAWQYAHFLGRSELAPPHMSPILHLLPGRWRVTWVHRTLGSWIMA